MLEIDDIKQDPDSINDFIVTGEIHELTDVSFLPLWTDQMLIFFPFVFPTLNPFASNPFFHLCRFLFKKSSSKSAKSSAYNSSQGNPISSNSLDSASKKTLVCVTSLKVRF